jgi:hypothetical protein
LREILEKLSPIIAWYRAFITFAFNPSRLLRIMLVVILTAFAFFVALEKGKFDGTVFEEYKLGMGEQHWIPATGILLGAVGWLITSIVTIRNSVKQHTINTLLQTRLSATYQEMAMHVRAGIIGHTPQNRAPLEKIKGSEQTREGVEYLLNYLEFMAVGIRHGDLHAGVMRDTMRGIVVRFTQIAAEFIVQCQISNGPRTYQNLLWLYNKWRDHSDPLLKAGVPLAVQPLATNSIQLPISPASASIIATKEVNASARSSLLTELVSAFVVTAPLVAIIRLASRQSKRSKPVRSRSDCN